MNVTTKKVQESQSQAAPHTSAEAPAQGVEAVQLVDERPEAIAQRRMIAHVKDSPLGPKPQLLQAMSPKQSLREVMQRENKEHEGLQDTSGTLQTGEGLQPKLVQRQVLIGDGAKNKFVKKKAILANLRDTQPKRGADIQNKVAIALAQGGVGVTETILDLFRNVGPILETAADLFARPEIELAFSDWDQALDSSLPMILPIAMTRTLIARLTEQFNQAKESAAISAGGALVFAETRFSEAMKLASKAEGGLSFVEWTRALAWAQVQITELQHLNKPKVAKGDDDWLPSKGKSQKRKEAQQEVSIVELVQVIDGHNGDPGAIAETFSRFVNAMEAQSVPAVPVIVDKYQSASDRKKGQFSVEVLIPLLDNWVIHAHCSNATGATAKGENPMHYKHIKDKHTLGMSIALTSRQEGILLPEPSARKAF